MKKLTKEKIIALAGVLVGLVVIGVIVFFTTRPTIIDDDDIPLGSGDVHADFYLDMSSSDDAQLHAKYIGIGNISAVDGSIKDDSQNVEAHIKYVPDVSAFVDDSHIISWKSIYKIASKYIVIGELIDKPVRVLYYPTLSDLIASGAEADAIAYTDGYYSEADGGAACYHIVSKSSKKADGVFVIKLNNGNFAELEVDTNSLFNVAVAGIFPGVPVSKEFNSLSKTLKGYVPGFKFNDGEYYFDKRVTLYSLTYEGTGNTYFIPTDDFEAANGSFSFFRTPEDGQCYSTNIDSINFLFNVNSSCSVLKQGSFTLLVLFNAVDTNITNCNFIAQGDVSDPAYKDNAICCWLKGNKIENVNVYNCSFIMDLGKVYTGSPSDNLLGGSFWINGDTPDSTINNVMVDHCSFVNTVNDEVVALWKGTFNDCSITNSIIECNSHNNNNMVSFFNGTYSNCKYENCHFNAYSYCNTFVKYRILNGDSEVLFHKCDFNSFPDSGSEISTFFYTASKQDIYPSVSLTVDTCSFNSNNTVDTFYKIQSARNVSFNVLNTTVNSPLKRGLMATSKSSHVNGLFTHNDISQIGEMLLNMSGITDSSVTISNNTISGNLTGRFDNYASVDYKVTDNICSECDSSVLFFANWLDPSYGKSNVHIEGNSFIGATDVTNFKNNRKQFSTEDLIEANWLAPATETE